MLEHHGDLVAAQLAQLGGVGRGEVGTADLDCALGGLHEPGHAAHQGGLARSRQTHDHERLAWLTSKLTSRTPTRQPVSSWISWRATPSRAIARASVGLRPKTFTDR